MNLYRYEMKDYYDIGRGFMTGVFYELYFESKTVEKIYKKLARLIPIPPVEIFNVKTKSYFKEYGYENTNRLINRLIKIIPHTKYHNTSRIKCVKRKLSESEKCNILYEDDFQVILKDEKE